jgi:predicted nucleotidyltransferase
MLRRPPIIDEIFKMLSDWATALCNDGIVGAYVFGSTVNEDGVRFDVDTSDIDVVLRTEWDDLDLAQRLDQLQSLTKQKEELETPVLVAREPS